MFSVVTCWVRTVSRLDVKRSEEGFKIYLIYLLCCNNNAVSSYLNTMVDIFWSDVLGLVSRLDVE